MAKKVAKKTTVVPEEKNGAEKVVSKKKFSLKEFFVNVGKGIGNGFKKLGSLIANHKKISIGVGVAIVIVLFVVTIGVSFGFSSSGEKVIKNRINDLGVNFYEEFYYKSAGNGDDDKRVEFLSKYEQIGIKVSLENLVRYYVTTDDYKEKVPVVKDADGNEKNSADASISERVDDLLNTWFKDSKYSCDKDKTKVIIYPQDPYEQTSYKIELDTTCGFKDEEESTTTSTTVKKETETQTTSTTKAEKETTTKKTTKKK